MTSANDQQNPWIEIDADQRRPASPTLERADQPDACGEAPLEQLSLGRRGFLQTLGLSGVVTGLAACERLPVRHALPYLVPPEVVTPGVTLPYASTCGGCPAACGLLVNTRDGRPIKLEGRPEHPLSRGGLCATAQASLRGLYDAGRLRTPSVAGKQATWDAVDQHVRAGLRKISDAGKSVFILTGSLVSPTARRTIREFLKAYGGTHVEYDAGTSYASALRDAYDLLTGRPVTPSLALDKTDLLVTLGADLLGAGPEPVAHTAAYSARRKQRAQRDFRHLHVEGSLSLTGAAADERLQATAGERRTIALALLEQIAKGLSGDIAAGVRALITSVPAPVRHAARVAEIAGRLVKHRGAALVVSGSEDRTEQLAVALINRLLDAEGRTLDLSQPVGGQRADNPAVEVLTRALAAGEVGALFVVDRNPIEELPDGDALAKQIAGLPLSVALDSRPTRTAKACKVLAAAHHWLECWGDAAPRPDILALAQPTIRPLFDTRDPFESLLHWSDGSTTSYRQHLRNSWRQHVHVIARDGAFDHFWNNALASGGVNAEIAASAFSDDDAAVALPIAPATDEQLRAVLAQAGSGESNQLEVELIAEVGVRDGRDSSNPWLREMPEPLTRTAWMGTVRVAPATARRPDLQLNDGDMVAVRVGDSEVRLPVRVLPGQHPNVLGVPVGYGLVDGDNATGTGGRNAYQLAGWQGGILQRSGLTATLRKLGSEAALPIVQPHGRTHRRPIIAQVSHPNEKVHLGHHPPNTSLWDEREYETHWEMVIDLDACTGCGGCVIACQAENNLPVVGPDEMRRHRDMHWIRIDRYFVGDVDDPDVLFEPMLCAQCDNAPCETVCPVAATVHSHDGLNQQVYNRCVGTRYCANNCPYKVRRFNWIDYQPKDPIERLVLNPDVVVRDRGVMEKCTFCVQRIQQARIAAKRDSAATLEPAETACQQSCPARAISFGDGKASESDVRELANEPRAFQVLAELGVRPSLTYLARVRRRDQPGNFDHDEGKQL